MKQSLSSYVVPQSLIPNFSSQLEINYILNAPAKHLISKITQKSGFSQGLPPLPFSPSHLSVSPTHS